MLFLPLVALMIGVMNSTRKPGILSSDGKCA